MTISTQRLRFLRGNSTAAGAFIGLQGELIFDTTLYTLRLQDGLTPGGYTLATSAQLANVAANANYGNSNVGAYLTSYTGNLSAGNIFSNNYLFANGVNILTGIQSNYGNANVAAYLPTYTGNVNAGNVSSTYIYGAQRIYSNAVIIGYGTNGSGLVGAPIIMSGNSTTSLIGTNGLANNVASNLIVRTLNSNISFQLTGVNKTWSFDTAGNLTIPGNISSSSNFSIDTSAQTVTLSANLSDWVFDETGVLTAPGEIETVGNITAGYFLGNGSQLTGIITNYSNANVASYLTSLANIKIGFSAGFTNQGSSAVAVGPVAAASNQGNYAVAVGSTAGQTDQGRNAIAIGVGAGAAYQGVDAIAIGATAGGAFQGNGAVAIGSGAGGSSGSDLATVAIGQGATAGGNYAVSIGNNARGSNANTIIINATGSVLNSYSSGFYVDPVSSATSGNVLYYNTSTKQITYGAAPETYGNANVAAYLPTYTGNISAANFIGNIQGPSTVFGNLSVTGNLIVTGNTITVSTNNFVVSDNIIFMANNNPANILDIGFAAHYTTDALRHTGFVKDVNDGTWKLFSNVPQEITTTVDFTDAVYDPIRTGNITAPYFIGDGSQLTGISTYSNANVASYLPTYTGNIAANIVKGTRAWTYDSTGNLTYPDGTKTSGNTVTLANSSSYYWKFNEPAGPISDNITLSFNSLTTEQGLWYFGTDNTANTWILNSGTKTINFSNNPGTTLGGRLTFGDAANIGNGTANDIELTSVNANAYVRASNSIWKFDVYGNIRLPSNSSVILYPNGESILSGITGGAGNYSNANVASYLPTYTGNISAANISLTNNTSAITFNTGAYIYGDTVSRPGSVVLQPNTSVAGFPSVVIGGAGRLAAPNGSIHAIFNTADLTVQVPLKVTSATAATSTSTGALTVSGGAGIVGNVYAGGAVVATGNITGNFFIGNGALLTGIAASSNYGNTNVAAYLTTYGGPVNANVITGTANATINGLVVNTSATIGTTLGVTGNITSEANVTVTGNVVASTFVTTGTGGNITGVNIVYGNLIGSGNTTVQEFTVNSNVTVGGTVGITGNVVVSGTGAISTPNLPSFRVYGTVGTQIIANTTISSTQGVLVDYNQGSYYNNTTGVFTAPLAGLYHCYATVRVGNNNGLNQVTIQKNSETSGANVIAFWETDTNIGSAIHFSMTGYAKCVAGDTIRLHVLTGNVNFDSNDSWGVTFIG